MNKRRKRTKAWLNAHRSDHYVRLSRDQGYRARSVYKLTQIDRRDRLLRPGMTVVDLGSAPGAWSQYVRERVGPSGRILALDLLEMNPIDGVEFVQGDFTDPALQRHFCDRLGSGLADLVISDLSPNISGIPSIDQARCLGLAESVLEAMPALLRPGGSLLYKQFEGEGTAQWRRQVAAEFQRCVSRNPDASRARSREFYLLARGYRGRP